MDEHSLAGLHFHKDTFYLHRSVFLPVNVQYDLAQMITLVDSLYRLRKKQIHGKVRYKGYYDSPKLWFLISSLPSAPLSLFSLLLCSIQMWWWHITEFPWLYKSLCLMWPSVTVCVLLVHSWQTGSFTGFFILRRMCRNVIRLAG